ncbi:aminoglycoside phosphotransferase family protein [Legionella sp. CNM-1927-20]|uniref:aminoglycoside phosphotransferase family protein n=1 Tax=Legionella sp. CNM-1927-20 TaxID=3422221 RepID=UPI00403B14E4
MNIDINLVQSLIEEQFPEWQHLSIIPVEKSGWDNRTFHLGKELSIRLPSSEQYSPQILKEFKWLPHLAKNVIYQVTLPLALGKPSNSYPWYWSINRWIEGDTVTSASILDINNFAKELGHFLYEFEKADATGGPVAGAHNFYRGGQLSVYDEEMRHALKNIQDNSLKLLIQRIWEQALSSYWEKSPVWVHGDLACNNILVKKGQLTAVIDFGQLAIGDPACDLVIAWNFFDPESREIFRTSVNLDKNTWIRAMGWALWKTVCWPIEDTDVTKIIEEICEDYRANFS